MRDLDQRIGNRTARIVVMGQGYVGLVVAMRASEAGFPVVGFEPDEERARRLLAGSSYIEDVSDETLSAALARGYQPSSSQDALADFDVAVVSVPTPLRDRAPDLSHVRAATRILTGHLRPGCLVILESTTYPGTTREMVAPILEESRLRAGDDFHLAYSPERIDPGNREYQLHNTPKLVAGIDESSLDLADQFLSTFVDRTVRASGCDEAELAKIIENTFRHVNIALVNEIAMYAHELGIDVLDAIDLAATKPFGFMRFTPGPGVGGHCLPIDPTYLSWRVKQSLGENFRFIDLANDINDHMPHYVVRRVTAVLNDYHRAVNGSRIVVLGASYKPNVGDLRESPALTVIRLLSEMGAQVVVVEPHATDLGVPPAVTHVGGLDQAELEPADLVVILTDHDAIDYSKVLASAPVVLDTRGRLWAAVEGNDPHPVADDSRARVERL